MRHLIYMLMFSLLILSCEKTINYPDNSYFGLSETQVNFNNEAGEQTVAILNVQGTASIHAISENSEWCTVSVSGSTITVKVTENVLVESRIAKFEVSDGKESIQMMVRQTQKYFNHIAGVENLTATPGGGQVTLKWEEPSEDNFSHVILYYQKNGTEQKVIVESGVTEYVIKELKFEDGEHVFRLQSVDKENDLGDEVSVSATPDKLIAFRFEKEAGVQWIPYYLRTSDTHTTTLRVGSMEYNIDEINLLSFEIDDTIPLSV